MEHGDDRATFGGVISKLISLILLCDDTPSDQILSNVIQFCRLRFMQNLKRDTNNKTRKTGKIPLSTACLTNERTHMFALHEWELRESNKGKKGRFKQI